MGSIGCRRQQLIAAMQATRVSRRFGDLMHPAARVAIQSRSLFGAVIFASLAACSGGFSNSDSSPATPSTAVAKPTINLAPSPSRVVVGGGATLVWSASQATLCYASGAWSGEKPTSGSQPVTELTSNAMYVLTCRGAGGETSQSAEIVVTAPAPAVTLTASPTTLAAGGTAVLTWTAANATTCSASGGWSGTLGPSGSLSTAALGSTASYTLTCAGAGGSASQTTTVTVASLPPIVALNASPTSVVAGKAAALTWASQNATSCVASGGWSGTKASAGTASTAPLTANTTFTVTCTGPGGNATQSASVAVTPAVPTVGIVARPSTVLKGQAAVLSWSSLNTTTCSASGGWGGARALAGSQSTGPLSATATYSVTCTGPGGTATQSTTVTTANSSSAPSVSLSVGPSAITSGGKSTLSWSATDATSCAASGAWSGGKPTSGSQSTGPLTASATYVLTCQGSSGTASQSATVSVTAPSPTVSFTASPSTVVAGKSTTLSWSATNATSCAAGGAWSGAKAASGTFVTGPISSGTTYALSCTGSGGTAAKTVTISVVSAAPTVTLSASPTTIKGGATSVLQWSASNATACTASGGWTGGKGTSGSQTTVPLSATTNFTLSCAGNGGSASQSVTVTVAAAAPSVSLLASPTTVANGASSTLTWSSSNASSCAASGGWSGTLAPNGSKSTGALTKTTTFTIKCSGAAGSATQSTSVIVAPGSTGNGTAILTWNAPTTNTDGSPVTPLAGYRIYYGTSPSAMTQSVTISNPSTLSYQVTGLASGTWYFAVAADAADGSESNVSGTVSKTI